MSIVTELAIHAIEEDLDLFETPEECLEYLQDDSNFKTISKQLTETMKKACGLSDDTDTKALIDLLSKKLLEMEYPEGWQEKTGRSTKTAVSRWFKEDRVPESEKAYKICFALGLDYDQANEFFRKGCGRRGFNVRNAVEAIYMYCLLNHRSWNDAQKLLKEFDSAPVADDNEHDRDHHTDGNTTQILTRGLKEESGEKTVWENDEAFLTKYLLPNKKYFIGYSKTAEKMYREQKTALYEKIIGKLLRDLPVTTHDDIDEKTDSTLLHLKSALLSFSEKIPEFTDLGSALEEDPNSAPEVWAKVMAYYKDTSDMPTGYDKPSFLKSILSTDEMLRSILHDIPYAWAKPSDDRDFVNSSRSVLSDLVSGILLKGGYDDFEKAPEKSSNSYQARKILMLLFYLNYVFDWTPETTFDEKNYDNFFTDLNALLDRCQFPLLYHADRFDWLMLRSVRELEISVDEDDPSSFFFDVLALSFDNSEAERYLSRYRSCIWELKMKKSHLSYITSRGFGLKGIAYDSDKVSVSRKPNASFTSEVEDFADTQRKILALTEESDKLLQETSAAIKSVPDPEQRKILKMHFIDFMDLEEIAFQLGKTNPQIQKTYQAGLAEVSVPEDFH